MFKYKCYLCGQIIWLKKNFQWVNYFCEVKGRYTKIYRIK